MATWRPQRVLGWLSLLTGMVGFSLPWAWYGTYEDSYLTYQMWNGWRWVGELFMPFVSPISPLVAGIELFPIIGALITLAWPIARKVWWWAVASCLSLLSLIYHIFITLDSEAGFGQSTSPTHYGPGLALVALGIGFLIAALWPWPKAQQQLASG